MPTTAILFTRAEVRPVGQLLQASAPGGDERPVLVALRGAIELLGRVRKGVSEIFFVARGGGLIASDDRTVFRVDALQNEDQRAIDAA
jgi:hypothetical protein